MGKEFKRCFVVPSLDDLNFVFRRFNRNHIRLVVSPDAVTAVTSRGELRVVAAISYARHGKRDVIVGIGDDPVQDVEATTVNLFSATATAAAEYDGLLEKFLHLLLKRLPKSKGIFRPVVLIEGLNSLSPDTVRRVRAPFIRALANGGAAAVVVDPAAT